MKVALVLWPIWGAGGLTTDVIHYRRILRKEGHQCDFFHVNYNNQKQDSQNFKVDVGQDGPRVRGYPLSITDRNIEQSVKTLNQYNCVMFLHPAPHITDKAASVSNWWQLYGADPSKIVRFTDLYLEDLYPDILSIGPIFEPWATNAGQQRYVEQFFPDCMISTYPFSYQNHGTNYEKSLDVMWPSAWRGWKGIKMFARAVPTIHGSIELYGSGRDLRQMRKAHDPVMQYSMGAVLPQQIISAYKRAKLSVDLTGSTTKYYGHCNRTLFEPMFFGCVSVCMKTLIEPYSYVPPEIVWLTDRPNVGERINELLRKPNTRKKIANAAYDWAIEFFSSEKVISEIQTVIN